MTARGTRTSAPPATPGRHAPAAASTGEPGEPGVAEDPAGRAPGATATPGRPGTGPVGTPAVAERLRPLFFPRRIVIAGLTPRPDAWGRLALGFLRAAGYDGEVLAWRPRHDDPEVRGIDSFADAGPVDLVLVAVPADAAIDVVAEAAGAAVGGAVVFSSGFAEDGPAGADRQRRLVDAAAGMPLLGPNCLGLVSGPGHVVASVSGFLTRPRHEGPVALVSQSGAIGFVLAEQLRRRGIGFSYYASTGNEAVVGVPDAVAYLATRPEVRVVACYLEGVRDVAAWRAACRVAADHDVSVVALKVGTTVAAQRAALSHTAAAAGDAELFEAICREDGVVLTGDEVAVAEAVCARTNPVELPARPRIGVVTMSGGGGAMIADQLRDVADIPELADTTRRRLHGLGVALAGDGNPVDLTGMFTRHLDQLDEVVDLVAADDAVDAVALYFTFGDHLVDRYRALARRLGAWAVPTWLVWAGAPEGEVEHLAPTGRVVPTIPQLATALKAQRHRPSSDAVAAVEHAGRPAADQGSDGGAGPLAALAELATQVATQVSDPVVGEMADETAGGMADGSVPTARVVLTEATVMPALVAAGARAAPFVVGTDATDVLARVRAAGLSAPYVVKVDHPGVAHRAAAGLVLTDVPGPAELASACDDLAHRAAVAGLDGSRLVAATMLRSAGAFSLGALRHDRYGPVVLVGPGEDLVDQPGARRAAACLPLSAAGLDALHAAARSACGRPVDIDQLLAMVVAVATVLHRCPTVTELDVNPVLVDRAGGLVAVDALAIAMASQAPRPTATASKDLPPH